MLWCSTGVVLQWCLCGGIFVVVWCTTGVVLEWCFCGGVFLVVWLVVLEWCFCGGVFLVVWWWWCFWGGGVKIGEGPVSLFAAGAIVGEGHKFLPEYF